ncbi:hypothetical protein [Candidatus Protofrankia datiscae]|nr:hypothetical protein [Candidatus Protofrankia datiscae]
MELHGLADQPMNVGPKIKPTEQVMLEPGLDFHGSSRRRCMGAAGDVP